MDGPAVFFFGLHVGTGWGRAPRSGAAGPAGLKSKIPTLALHEEQTSSNEYRMPPSGALNAAATPAAAPIPTHSRWFLGSRSSKKRSSPNQVVRETTAPAMAPMCTMGPSLPRGRAVETTNVMPIDFAMSAVPVAHRLRWWMPLRYALSAGRPEPLAWGAHIVSSAASRMRHVLSAQ